MNKFLYLLLLMGGLASASCQAPLPQAILLKEEINIFPDYRGVTIPYNIAPLNFRLQTAEPAFLLLVCKNEQIRIDNDEGRFQIPVKAWKRLTSIARGEEIQATIYLKRDNEWYQYPSFSIIVSEDGIDGYLVYRRIAPGFRLWNEMGIYQRNLEGFTEVPVMTNKQTNNNCINCHSFCLQDADKMLFHQRMTHGGTYFVVDGKIEKLNTQFCDSIKTLVYPYWHPSGRFVAFSTNDTKQDFHLNDPNRIEVFDNKSNVVVYDIERHEVLTVPLLFSDENLETFPCFSPDGKELYFCSAPSHPMPESYRDIKYNLLRISFDADKRIFGEKIDTLYHAFNEGRSVSFPRIAPNGRYLMYTVSDYGNFSIWHKDANLQMIDLHTGKTDNMDMINSNDVESYHSWSSNGCWFVFSSRREDGLYTRPYFAHIDNAGRLSKPFLLPQEYPDYYDWSLFSFNIPELVKDEIDVETYQLVNTSKFGKSTPIQMSFK